MRIYHDVSLRSYNTFGIDCTARELIEFEDREEIAGYFLGNRTSDLSGLLVLGGGSNILFTKNVDGTIVKFTGTEIQNDPENTDHIHIRGEAGINWHEFVLKTIEAGYQGLENLSLIPGQLGAAPIQNIGAYGVEIQDYLDVVEYFDLVKKEFVTLSNADCRFGYRDSIFKHELKGNAMILSVQFKLNKVPHYNISYKDLQNKLSGKNISDLTPSLISDLVIEIRRSKLPDPAITGNAGSFFKNPVVAQETAEQLKKEFPGITAYGNGPGLVKISAAWLIDQCKWKGVSRGQAGVHDRQPLVLINRGKATGMDILNLALEIRESVEKKFGIILEPEINIV
jgi:UDP-N-acetylmuramate dehydrogenase